MRLVATEVGFLSLLTFVAMASVVYVFFFFSSAFPPTDKSSYGRTRDFNGDCDIPTNRRACRMPSPRLRNAEEDVLAPKLRSSNNQARLRSGSS